MTSAKSTALCFLHGLVAESGGTQFFSHDGWMDIRPVHPPVGPQTQLIDLRTSCS
jgi:hypothetical protein